MRRLTIRRGGVIVAAVAAPWVLWALLRTLGLEYGHPLVALVAFSPYTAGLAPLPVLVAQPNVARSRAAARVARSSGVPDAVRRWDAPPSDWLIDRAPQRPAGRPASGRRHVRSKARR